MLFADGCCHYHATPLSLRTFPSTHVRMLLGRMSLAVSIICVAKMALPPPSYLQGSASGQWVNATLCDVRRPHVCLAMLYLSVTLIFLFLYIGLYIGILLGNNASIV